MAPRSAPSLRPLLPVLAFLLQTVFIGLFAFFIEIRWTEETSQVNTYAVFQDVHVVVFLGFGFLTTFLVRYGFSGSGFSLLVAAMAVQWATLLNGFLLSTWNSRKKIAVDLDSLVDAELCAASSLIAMGAVLGKVNPVQYMLMALLEVTSFVVSQWLLQTLIRIQVMNTIMYLHIFGAFFGIMTSWVLYRKGTEQQHEKEKSDHKTGLFSMLGTLFLWMFWPSCNLVLLSSKWWTLKNARRREIESNLSAVYGTYLALAASSITAFGMSVLTSPRGKINLVHMQSSILAGGVAFGGAMTAVHVPWIAMTLGSLAAVLSAVGFRYLKPHMQLAFECHDTCGVLNAHGMPGILGWFACLLLQLIDTEDNIIAIRLACYHISILFIMLAMSLVLGAITGFILKWNFWRAPQNRKCFDDQAFWEFPHLATRK
ncbi:rh blood group, D antigen [Chanos chanos]|uniref:Rh blood group, D antigen n=1 Tax=Chanos chanos TaxID=29144 RepID=A0A6J2V7P2_CHACN|nr:ammonium transporter Rh type A-like [Chanos chanos]